VRFVALELYPGLPEVEARILRPQILDPLFDEKGFVPGQVTGLGRCGLILLFEKVGPLHSELVPGLHEAHRLLGQAPHDRDLIGYFLSAASRVRSGSLP
jgi:hypothetical protein